LPEAKDSSVHFGEAFINLPQLEDCPTSDESPPRDPLGDLIFFRQGDGFFAMDAGDVRLTTIKGQLAPSDDQHSAESQHMPYSPSIG
jgi:hypothetical protein